MEWRLKHYNDSLSAPIVLNKAQIQNTIYIMIPSPEFYSVTLIHLYEVTQTGATEVDFTGKIVRDGGRPWLITQSEILSQTAGQHLYKFTFVDSRIDAEVDLWLTYIIQDDNPEKPYIYMKRSDT